MSDSKLATKRVFKIIFYCAGIVLLTLAVFWMYRAVTYKQKKNPQDCGEKIEEKISIELENAIHYFENDWQDKYAFDILKKYAALGNSKAKKYLALYYSGKGLFDTKMIEEINDFAQKLIDENNPYGYYLRGVYFINKYTGKVDKDENLKKAADAGVPEAALVYAIYVEREKPEEAEKYFKLAIQQNYATAIHQYAWFLVNNKRYDEAVKILQTANDRRSLDLLSLCYHNGWGVPIDSKKAFEYSKKSLEAPDVYQLFPPAVMRFNGNSNTIYEVGLEEAVFNGETEFYEQCLRISADVHLKLDSWHTAHESEAAYGFRLLQKKDFYNAVKYFENAAAKQDKFAAFVLGCAYFDRKEYEKAERYFLQVLPGADIQLKKETIERLVYLYLETQDFVKLKHFAAIGHELEITSCRNNIAILAMRNSGEVGLAKAAALFALSIKEEDKMAKTIFQEIFETNFKRLQNIADKGNADAAFALSEYYFQKGDKSPEFEKGKEYFEKAVNLEHPIACYILANIYARGLEGHKMDMQKGMKYYQIAAAKGFKPATKNIAFLLATRPEFRNTPVDEIRYWYDVSCFQDEEDMYFYWGKVFENIVKDEKFAEELYREGAKRNDYNCLIVMYSILKKRNSDEAHTFLERAIDCKFWKGYFFKGLEVEKTQPRDAYMNYIKSYLLDANPFTAEKIVQCLLEGIGCQADSAKAIKFAEREIKNGAINMYCVLGDAYRDGKVVPKDLNKAKEYYIKGAAAGNPDCKAALEKLNAIK